MKILNYIKSLIAKLPTNHQKVNKMIESVDKEIDEVIDMQIDECKLNDPCDECLYWESKAEMHYER